MVKHVSSSNTFLIKVVFKKVEELVPRPHTLFVHCCCLHCCCHLFQLASVQASNSTKHNYVHYSGGLVEVLLLLPQLAMALKEIQKVLELKVMNH